LALPFAQVAEVQRANRFPPRINERQTMHSLLIRERRNVRIFGRIKEPDQFFLSDVKSPVLSWRLE